MLDLSLCHRKAKSNTKPHHTGCEYLILKFKSTCELAWQNNPGFFCDFILQNIFIAWMNILKRDGNWELPILFILNLFSFSFLRIGWFMWYWVKGFRGCFHTNEKKLKFPVHFHFSIYLVTKHFWSPKTLYSIAHDSALNIVCTCTQTFYLCKHTNTLLDLLRNI